MAIRAVMQTVKEQVMLLSKSISGFFILRMALAIVLGMQWLIMLHMFWGETFPFLLTLHHS